MAANDGKLVAGKGAPAVAPGAYWALAALCAMNLLNYIDRFILAAVSAPVQKDLDVPGKALTGILGMAFLVSYSLCSPLMGWLGDRMRRTHLLALGVGTWSLATFASGLAGYLHLPAFGGLSGGFWEMLAARSVLGVGEATYTILAPALIADLFPRERRSLALAVFYIAIPIGAALGYGLGGVIDRLYGWRAAFFVVGLPGLVVALLALALREPRRGETEAGGPAQTPPPPPVARLAGELARNRSYVFNLLGMAMFAFALGGLQFWAPDFFETERHLDRVQVNVWLGAVV
ncbi:MAG TPA: MFS transporter, partial [Gemmataceae bacterium]|nr:MFS transporter [Gemmataceae bacterium]